MSALSSQASGARALVGVNTIAVLPPRLDQGVVGDRETIFQSLSTMASRELQVEISPRAEVVRLAASGGAGSDAASAAVAKRLGADSALVTQVHSMIERDGSALGVNSPAAVSFTMRLLRSSDGLELWRETFTHRERSASEDILGAARRLQDEGSLGWRSAGSSLEAGFTATLRKLNDDRLAHFTAK